MLVGQHMKRWCIPPAKSANVLLPQTCGVSQPYFHWVAVERNALLKRPKFLSMICVTLRGCFHRSAGNFAMRGEFSN